MLAEKLKVFKLVETPAVTKPLGVGRMRFLMENAHCATAETQNRTVLSILQRTGNCNVL